MDTTPVTPAPFPPVELPAFPPASPHAPAPNPAAAEAAAAEAEDDPRTLTFGEGEDAVTVTIPRKWKRFKFMRALTRGDVGTAMEAVWPPSPALDEKGRQMRDAAGNLMWEDHPTLILLEDAEVSQEEFGQTMERLGQAVSGITPGNSAASPS